MMEVSHLITVMLILLCSLAALDLWRQTAIKNDAVWFEQYTHSVKSSYRNWKIGYRLEDLEIKLESQKERYKSIRHLLATLAPKFRVDTKTLRTNSRSITNTRQYRIAMHDYLMNDSTVFQIRCESGGQLLRVGVNDFRTDSRDVCQVFTSANDESVGPHTMFDRIYTDEGSFALKNIGSGLFVKAVPPPPDNSNAPWKLVVGGAAVGIAETFRLSEEGYLYSSIMGGFFTCDTGQMVAGQSGKYGSFNHFVLEEVSPEQVQEAYGLVDLSRQVLGVQTRYHDLHQKTDKQQRAAASNVTSTDNPNVVRICLGVPMTSKGTQMSSVLDSPFWTNLFDSFMKSVDWRSNRYQFHFFLGFDRGDNMYDTGDAWQELREEFRHRATFRMTEQLMDEAAINSVLDSGALAVKLMHFEDLAGAPTQVVSQLMLKAYADGFDYFYQVNDDTIITSPNWAPRMIATLASNPAIPNFGVTGPSDSNNEKIFTHAFVHRTHMEVFGHLFPPYFKNWWSDDWISTVYGAEHTFRNEEVQIKHNVEAQKTKGYTRYQVDQAAQLRLSEELRKGHVQIDEWLRSKSLPRLPLPNICGYIPSVRHIASAVKLKGRNDRSRSSKSSQSSTVATMATPYDMGPSMSKTDDFFLQR